MSNYKSIVWVLVGFTGSTPGLLELNGDRLSLTVFGSGAMSNGHLQKLEQTAALPGLAEKLKEGKKAILFDATLNQVHTNFPWYYFSGGANLWTNQIRLRLSFVQPQNTVLPGDLVSTGINLVEGRSAGIAWKEILAAG